MKSNIKERTLVKSHAYINGKWIDPKGKKFPVLNPFDEKEIVSLPDLGKKETVKAIEAAHIAFATWSKTLAKERAQKLYCLAQLIEQNADDLALLLTSEQGKPLNEAKGEVLGAAEVIKWFGEEAARIHGFTQPDPDEGRNVATIRQPVGVVGVITPWNFPFSIPAQKAFAAIAAGCTVVIKPAEDTPLSTLALAYLSQEAGIPPGVFNVITCSQPEEVGKELTTNQLVGKVTFTGSTEVGKKILEASASTVKKVTLELGGNCPLIVFDDADLEKALQGAFSLKFYNAGQCCNSINRFLVHRSLYSKFVEKFTKKATQLTTGSGLKSANIGPLINRAGKQKVEELLKDAASHGAEIVLKPKQDKSLLCSPVVIKNATPKMRLWSEEIFGPVAAFYVFDTEEEAIALANNTRYGLAAYFYSENIIRALRVARALEAGTVGINTTNVYSVTLPFGGWKESGLGREGGIVETLNDYCELKALSFGK